MTSRKVKPGFALAACILTGVCATAHADTLSEITQRGKLVCATQDSNVPYAFLGLSSDEFIGYDVDICAALAKGLGVALGHKGMRTALRFPALKDHQVDIIVGIVSKSPEVIGVADISAPYLQENVNVMVSKSSGITTKAELLGKRICVSESERKGKMAQHDFTAFKSVLYRNAPTCFLNLKNGNVDAFIANELVLGRFERQSRKEGAGTITLDEPFDAEYIGVAVNKGNPKLLTAINEILEKMERTGELRTLHDKWLGPDTIFQRSRILKRDLPVKD